MGEENQVQAPKTDDLETRRAVKAAMAQHSKVIVGDDKETQQRCMDEIKGVLAKYDCVLVPQAMLSPGAAEFMIHCRKRPKGVGEPLAKMENPYAQQAQQGVPPSQGGTPVQEEEEEPPLD